MDEGMQLAQPLDDWCHFCENKMAVMHSLDGVPACQECATDVIEALRKTAAEMEEVKGLHVGPNRQQRRAAKRQMRLRNDGRQHGG